MDSRKLFVILGITGNQGGSVAHTFLTDPTLARTYRLRGITRDPTSAASLALAARGVEIAQADLHDRTSLRAAFASARVIFSVTDFWAPFFDPANQAAARAAGQAIGEYAYEREYAQGRNVADAAAGTPTVERLVVSMLSSPRRWSGGRWGRLWHYESKADMVTYVKREWPELAEKMSCVNMGVFFFSWKIVPLIGPRRTEDGTYVLTLPSKGRTPSPLVDPRVDTGVFVRALLKLEPGIQVYGETSLRSWREWLELWGSIQGEKVRYEEVSIDFYEETLASQGLPVGFGTEIAEIKMFAYMEDCGYDGGDPDCRRKEELGVDLTGLSSVEDYIRSEDWGIQKTDDSNPFVL